MSAPIRWQLACAGLLAVALLGVTVARPITQAGVPRLPLPRNVAAVVDGEPVPLSLYQRELGIYRATLTGGAASGHEAAAEDRALRQAVAVTIIAREARRRKFSASPSAVRAELARMRAEAGGSAALASIARMESLRPADLQAMARTSVLNDLLTRHDAHLIDRLYARARIAAYVGPHAGLRGLAPAPLAGHPAPELAATTLDGRAMTLSSVHGTSTVLAFWSTACTWCRVEMPLLDRFARAHPGIRVIALNIGDNRSDTSAYASALGLRLPIWLDPDGAAARIYDINGLPDTFVIDRDGVIRSVTVGAFNHMGVSPSSEITIT